MNPAEFQLQQQIQYEFACSDLAFHPNPEKLSSVREYQAIVTSQVALCSSQSSEIFLCNISNKNQSKVTNFSGHKGGIFSVSYSQEGEILGSVGEDKAIKLWTSGKSAGHHISIPNAHSAPIRSIDFFSDFFITGSDDKTVKVWNLRKVHEKKAFLTSFTGHSNWIRTCKFSPEGSIAASGGDDGTIRIWTMSKTSPLVVYSPFLNHSSQKVSIQKIAFHSSGSMLAASTDYERKILIYDLRSDNQVCTIQDDSKMRICSSSGISFDPTHSNHLLTNSLDVVTLWDIRYQKKLVEVTTEWNSNHIATPVCMYSNDGTQIGASCKSGLNLWTVLKLSDKVKVDKRKKATKKNVSIDKTSFTDDPTFTSDAISELRIAIEKISSQIDLLTQSVIAIDKRLNAQEELMVNSVIREN